MKIEDAQVISEETKLEDSEMDQLKNLQKKNSYLRAELAEIGLTELLIKERKKGVENFVSKLREEEFEAYKTIETKYGIGSVDLETGVFTPKK